MRKILVFYVFTLFIGCKSENDFADLNLHLRNETNVDWEDVMVFFMENHSKGQDTLMFDLMASEERTINYRYTPGGGEGGYILLLGNQSRSFGYYPSTLSQGDNSFYFKIQEDTVLISQRAEGFW